MPKKVTIRMLHFMVLVLETISVKLKKKISSVMLAMANNIIKILIIIKSFGQKYFVRKYLSITL